MQDVEDAARATTPIAKSCQTTPAPGVEMRDLEEKIGCETIDSGKVVVADIDSSASFRKSLL